MSEDWNDVIVPEGWSLEVLKEVDSTNAELRRRSDCSHGMVVVAERQTQGRGRRGAEWHAVTGESLAFSVALRPNGPRAHWPRLALAAGVAVAEALAKFGIEAEVKWPNDVLVEGRKVCGILVEATDELAIVGVGVNVGQDHFDGELDGVAISLRMAGRLDLCLAEVLSRVLSEMEGWSRHIGASFPDLIQALRERCALRGKLVSLQASDGSHQGRVCEISESGELVVELSNGVRSFLQANDVRVVSE